MTFSRLGIDAFASINGNKMEDPEFPFLYRALFSSGKFPKRADGPKFCSFFVAVVLVAVDAYVE